MSEPKDFTVIEIAEDPFYSPQDAAAEASSTKQKPSSSGDTVERISAFISDWTPFCLVASYYVFSTCLYMYCSDGLIAVFWFIYMCTNFYIAGATVLEAFMSITPCREARKIVTQAEQKAWNFPTPDSELLVLDLLIVAYLPNEKDIIMDRALYALQQIDYPRDKIRINILYNTPKPMEPLETQLNDLTHRFPHARVIKVPGSTSKADNLNHFLTLETGSDLIAIYDCDHYPHPNAPRWAVERFMADQEIDIVQGRCVVFNAAETYLTSMIAVEFDKIYAVSHPGRATMWGFGLFCGSNGYWRSSLLRELKMDGDMLTEDIDSALRAFSRGAKTVHDLNVTSYELAPTTFPAFWKQRLRWAQGWAQASMKHVKMVYNKPQDQIHAKDSRSFVARFGIFSLLLIREVSYYLVTQYTCLVLSFLIVKFPKTGSELFKLVYFQYPISQWLFIISIVCLVATLWITNQVKSEFVSRGMIISFSLMYPGYLILSATIGLYGHARQVVRYSSWNPTARK
ncbi:N-acetylglucosaminyltransferas-like protein [Mytilinidion resinicola]|uniref:N-acetylglucosaminyltransferas-like protein n=1 Tax=Mytilinidion resinicola TaxID=574789 RepID=A0A6A6YP82_9PEZI|nr:N-acetylglucosaminyltransferas-like protein [Mytilinidion resinicola]KAF2810383.1 N-acetylglucosaminyltransferas-like protein [Mytilinidion resinicola]